MARISASQKFKKILAILEKEYGRREHYKPHPPVEQTLITLLLKDGREDHAVRTLRRLEREFVDWNEVRVCDPEYLDQIFGNGFPSGVGRLVRDTLTAIFNHSQSMNLDDIVELSPNEAEGKLRKLPMPSRVMGELLLANLGYKKLPAGAGLLRVARRTKLVQQTASDERIKTFRHFVPSSLLPRAFHAFEMLAERVCHADECSCRACPISSHCPTGTDTLKRLEIQEEQERAAREAEAQAKKQKLEREHKAKAHKKAATEKLKKAIEVRKQSILKTRKRKSAPRKREAPPVSRMVQASSAHVRPTRTKKRRKRLRQRTRPARG